CRSGFTAIGIMGGSGYAVQHEDGSIIEWNAGTQTASVVVGAWANRFTGRVTGLSYEAGVETVIMQFSETGIVATDGGSQERFAGSMFGTGLNGPIVAAVSALPGPFGYYMVGTDGGIFAFDVQFRGSMGGLPLNEPVVGITPDPDGDGYWLVASDGGIFAFDADFKGSIPGVLAPGQSLNQPINGVIPYGDGYLMVASDGGVFNFSNRPFLGSLPGDGAVPEGFGVVAIAAGSRDEANPDPDGYVMLDDYGNIYAYGDLPKVPLGAICGAESPFGDPVPNPNIDLNCADFVSAAEAQAVFDTYHDWYGDLFGIDGDGDGIPCEPLGAVPVDEPAPGEPGSGYKPQLVSNDGTTAVFQLDTSALPPWLPGPPGANATGSFAAYRIWGCPNTSMFRNPDIELGMLCIVDGFESPATGGRGDFLGNGPILRDVDVALGFDGACNYVTVQVLRLVNGTLAGYDSISGLSDPACASP
ncbi:MAG: excalibur calcium-binding domain-containing protein, partial [Propionibacteriaceae bacterium]|nr:excalibur calcium-binding domain-containing protein [Propionibacteriaceae bacterium]